MNLYDFMCKRKSTRKYLPEALDSDMMADIKQFADSLKPLVPGLKTAYEISGEVKNIMPVKAPHYFIISGEKKEGWLLNAGFMWEQMDLYLSSLGLGSCWLGMARPSQEPKTNLNYVLALAFGKPQTSPYRDLQDFNRKPLSEISSGSDKRLEVVRLAPSATNSQNWFFEVSDNAIDVFRKKLNPVMALAYDKFNQVDMGIALCFLYYATIDEGKTFSFTVADNRDKAGYIYTGTVTST